jgi:hypothetical protein
MQVKQLNFNPFISLHARTHREEIDLRCAVLYILLLYTGCYITFFSSPT